MTTATNRLANATSPYLRQHAHHPVDWHPWGTEAFALARREGKPVLLSIGYAACHWCHVMAGESFEDPATAALMNGRFVNIKVDREERPDLDQIYQAAHQLLTRQPGGWPLTVFLCEDQAPFFSGTYFPKAERHGLPGFSEVLTRVSEAYAQRGNDVRGTGAAVRDALARLATKGAPVPLQDRLIDEARAHFRGAMDLRQGGLGRAPKFPRSAELEFCLRAAHEADDRELLHGVLFALRRIAEGGLRDHLGGGFYRYCVDGFWEIPHFEKMLYDNALLLRLYADAYALDGDPLFSEAAAGIVAWLRAEMQAPQGLFYSSLDADSEHEEGKYYVWEPAELEALLDSASYRVAAEHWGWAGTPNFEGHAWHLRVAQPADAVAERLGLAPEMVRATITECRGKLKAERDRRVRPGLDDKLLSSWNALTITALARAGRVFGRGDWLGLARRAHAALLDAAWRKGRLNALAQMGDRELPGYLDDYAFLLEATLELVESDFHQTDLELAQQLAEVLRTEFRGMDGGGFYFTALDHENLLARMRTGFDQATPSGNGVAAKALLRLGVLSGHTPYSELGEEVVRALAPQDREHFEGQGALLSACLEWSLPPALAWLRGPHEEVRVWLEALPAYRPGILALDLALEPGPQSAPRPAQVSVTSAWVCREGVCSPPLVNLAAFLDVMGLGAA
ncbi:MAG: thioredoxin domain-containing protein [Betaproteobacteria bacterium]|nr:thioredoxin domain-containing protein [Betaproteobacteria bacterium]